MVAWALIFLSRELSMRTSCSNFRSVYRKIYLLYEKMNGLWLQLRNKLYFTLVIFIVKENPYESVKRLKLQISAVKVEYHYSDQIWSEITETDSHKFMMNPSQREKSTRTPHKKEIPIFCAERFLEWSKTTFGSERKNVLNLETPEYSDENHKKMLSFSKTWLWSPRNLSKQKMINGIVVW